MDEMFMYIDMLNPCCEMASGTGLAGFAREIAVGGGSVDEPLSGLYHF